MPCADCSPDGWLVHTTKKGEVEMNTHVLAVDFFETAEDAFKRQDTARPVVYFHHGQFEISRGDQLGGVAAPVYEGKAEIILGYTQLYEYTNPMIFTREEGIEIIQEALNDFLRTIVYFENHAYTLTQDAYIDGIAGERPHYKAHGVDEEGNEVLVIWNVYDNWADIEDEGDMCDWSNPASVEKR